MDRLDDVHIVPEFCDQGVDCYRLEGGSLSEYYIVSEAGDGGSHEPSEVVGDEAHASLVTATADGHHLKEQKKITSANILSILRGALNYPLDKASKHIRVHDISFMSSERVFGENDEMLLDQKYCKLTMVPNSALTIGDIIASAKHSRSACATSPTTTSRACSCATSCCSPSAARRASRSSKN